MICFSLYVACTEVEEHGDAPEEEAGWRTGVDVLHGAHETQEPGTPTLNVLASHALKSA